MHQTSVRPTPLSFAIPPTPQSPVRVDHRKDVGYPSILPQINHLGYIKTPVKVGLRTPPEDDMNSAYPEYQNYEGRNRQNEIYNARRISDYDGAATQFKQGSIISAAHGVSRVNSDIPFAWPPVNGQARGDTFHPSTLSALESESAQKPQAKKPWNTDAIHPNLQIPDSINDSGGSLAEFAAKMTCLFWFESIETLNRAENSWSVSNAVERLRPEAFPTSGFTKWVVTILTTTQLTPNVIILALLFIYRLKSNNPSVKGRSGSEFRLLTVALMLGNKFLDDNTYTNKTWAEVSGISVTEIHIMEVEFLKTMRYSLLASAEEFAEWQRKLGNFGRFCDRAVKSSPQPLNQPNLPSPPASMQCSPPAQTSQYTSPAGHYNSPASWLTPGSTGTAPSISPLAIVSNSAYQDSQQNPRKRSILEDIEEPVAKRISRPSTSTPTAPGNFNMDTRPRLPPVPKLMISTSQAMSGYNGLPSLSQNAPLLPPLSGWALSPLNASFSVNSMESGNIGHVSPSSHLSPSGYYQHRNSPWRPIRHLNTLLDPPPPASMNNYSVNTSQMHYQPLGKRHDYRSGVVPAYGSQYTNIYPVLPMPQPNV